MAKDTNALELALRDHQIGFVLNAGEEIIGHLRLQRGALIHGYVDGSIECAKGSVIVTEPGCVTGAITADRVLVEGSIKSLPNQPRYQILGRELISIGSTANVDADLISKAFSLHSTAIQGEIKTL